MSSDRTSLHSHLPAPCIVDAGTVVNKQDMRRLLCDLGAVRYRYTQGEHCISEGEGYVVEVFADPHEATLVTNHSLYLNVCSFDYLELEKIPQQPWSPSAAHKLDALGSPDEPSKPDTSSGSTDAPTQDACLSLIQENIRLQLIPLSNPLKARRDRTNSVALDAVVADMLSTNLDINEDDDSFPF